MHFLQPEIIRVCIGSALIPNEDLGDFTKRERRMRESGIVREWQRLGVPDHHGRSCSVSEPVQQCSRARIPVDVTLRPDHIGTRRLKTIVVGRCDLVSRTRQNLFNRTLSFPAAQHRHTSRQTAGLSYFVVPSLVLFTEMLGSGSCASSRSLIASSSARFPSLIPFSSRA